MASDRMTGPSSSQPSGSPDRYIILPLVLAGVLMAVVDGSVVSIALPTITRYFGVSLAQSQMIMTSYLVTLTSLLLIFGKVAEYLGRARTFRLGVALFTASSLFCGLSPSLDLLVLCRVTQAAGAAMMFSISSAIIFQAFPRGEQGRAMGYIGSTVAVGSIIGPTLGGFIVDYLGWSYIFLINVPIGAVQLLLTSRYMRLEERRSQRLSVDWVGSATLIAFIVSLMALLGRLSGSFQLDRSALGLLLAFLASLAVFLYNESRHGAPPLDMSIFRYPLFVLPCISMILFFVANLMVSVLGPFYFEEVMGLSATQVGLIYLIVPAIMVVGSPVTGWIYDRRQFRYLAALGMSVMAAAMLLLATLASSSSPDLRLILTAFAVLGAGGVLFQSPNNTEIMRALPKEKINIASSFTATIRNMGMALGVSLSGVFVSMQLSSAGYAGTLVQAGPALVSLVISRVMMLAGVLCLIGTAVSISRGRKSGR